MDRSLAVAVDDAIAALDVAATAYVEAQAAANSENHKVAREAGRQPSPGIDPLSILRAAISSKPNLARWLMMPATNPSRRVSELYPEG
jgi:hypothetical protein